MKGSGVYCPDYTRDLTIREKVAEKVAVQKPKSAKGKRKKASDFHIL
jgi:hypothetical protein